MWVEPLLLERNIIQVDDSHYFNLTELGWMYWTLQPDETAEDVLDLRPVFDFTDAGACLVSDTKGRMWYIERDQLPIQLADRIQINRRDHTRVHPNVITE